MGISNNKYLSDFGGEHTQRVTGVILTLITMSVLILFAINPTLSTIAKLQKEIEDIKIVDKKLQQKIIALDSLQKEYLLRENDILIVLESIPKSPLIPLFIGQVQSLARSSNVNISLTQKSQVDLFVEEKDPQKYHDHSFSIDGGGTYKNISTFLEDIINMQRVVGIDSLSINKGQESSEFLQFNLAGKIYYKEETL